jgi:hypothetical protein
MATLHELASRIDELEGINYVFKCEQPVVVHNSLRDLFRSVYREFWVRRSRETQSHLDLTFFVELLLITPGPVRRVPTAPNKYSQTEFRSNPIVDLIGPHKLTLRDVGNAENANSVSGCLMRALPHAI